MVEKIEKKEQGKKEEKWKTTAFTLAAPRTNHKPNEGPGEPLELTREGSSSSGKRAADTQPKGRPQPKRKANPDDGDDDVQMEGVKLNRNTSSTYWVKQSANELRAQLSLRGIPRSPQWIYKKDLVEIIRKLIKEKKW